MTVSPTKVAESIEMPVGVWNCVSGGGAGLPRERAILGCSLVDRWVVSYESA